MYKTIPLYLHYRHKLTSSPLFKGLKSQTLDKMMEGFRYDDIRRWKQGAKLVNKDFGILWDGAAEARLGGSK